MPRRRSPPPKDAQIPKDWTPHDGGPCPVAPASCPAVLFRYGAKMRMGGYQAKHWQAMEQDAWTWAEREPDGFDIIAYQPEEDEWVTIPRIPEPFKVAIAGAFLMWVVGYSASGLF